VSTFPLSPKWSEPATSVGPPMEPAVAVSCVSAGAVVSIRGELDRLGARELGTIVDGVIDAHRSIVLDRAELDFINSWGLEANCYPSVAPTGAEGLTDHTLALGSGFTHARDHRRT
jgi:hypothetical protein